MSKPPNSENLQFDGPAGKLQAILETPKDTAPTAVALVCHPHPLHGGTMGNKVAHTLARSFTNCNFGALRFNFRGVEASEGEFDHGEGEVDDVMAAAAWLAGHFPGMAVWLAGFSFGAAMAVRAAQRLAPAGLVSIAPATSRFGGTMQDQPQCPWLIIQGDQDELVPIDETIAWVNELQAGPELQIFPETEHFFHGRLVQLRGAVEQFVQRNSPHG